MSDIDQLRDAVDARPDDALAWAQLARALAEADDRDGAREALFPATTLPGTTAEVLIEIGFVHELLQDPQRAAAAYRRAAALDRRSAEAYRAHATLLIRAGDLRAATLVLRAAVLAVPDAHELHLLLAHALERTGQLPEAERHAREAVRLAPSSADALKVLARIYDVVGKRDLALAALKKLHPLAPGDFDVAVSLGAKLAASGARDEASRLLAEAEKRAPSTYPAQLELGRALRDARTWTAAIQHLEEAARIKPSAPEPHRELATAYEAAGSTADAIHALKTAVKLAPDDAPTHQRLGVMFQKAGLLREAVGAFVKAAALAPDDPELHEQLARAMEEKRLRETGPVPTLAFGPDTSLGSFGGDLKIFALPEVIEFLVHQQKSGVVRVASMRGEGSIELYEGRVVRVRAPKLRPLSQVLEDLDAATSTDMKRAFAGAVDPADDLAVARRLLDEQIVDQQLIHDALGRQALEGLTELVGWNEGQVSFTRTTDPSVIPELSFDTRYLLLEVMRRLDEAKRPSNDRP